jgi:hypothetical protein
VPHPGRDTPARPRKLIMYYLPPGTEVSVCRASDENRRWSKHTTRQPLFFSYRESNNSGASIFRQDGWLIMLRSSGVIVLSSVPGKSQAICATCGHHEYINDGDDIYGPCPKCYSSSSSNSGSSESMMEPISSLSS